MENEVNKGFRGLRSNVIRAIILVAAALALTISLLRPKKDTSRSSVETATSFKSLPAPQKILKESPEDTDSRPYYLVISDRAYFHSKPTEASVQKEFFVNSDKIHPLADTDDYILAEMADPNGKLIRGWILKTDLRSP